MRVTPAVPNKSATSLAPIETRGLSFLVLTGKPEIRDNGYNLFGRSAFSGITINSNSNRLSAGGKVLSNK